MKENGDFCGILSRRHCVVDAIARIWILVRKKWVKIQQIQTTSEYFSLTYAQTCTYIQVAYINTVQIST